MRNKADILLNIFFKNRSIARLAVAVGGIISILLWSLIFLNASALVPFSYSTNNKIVMDNLKISRLLRLGFQTKFDSFQYRNFISHDVGSMLTSLNSLEGYFGVAFQKTGPFFLNTKDGTINLSSELVNYVRMHMRNKLTWIGDETIGIQTVSNQYSAVMTYYGRLHEGFHKNCVFIERDLVDKNRCVAELIYKEPFSLEFLKSKIGTEGVINYLKQKKVDAIIAGSKTYDETKNLLLLDQDLRKCFNVAFFGEKEIVLENTKCRGI